MAEEAAKLEVGRPVERAPINIDITRGITPHTYSELLQFAALYRESGLAPKSFTTTPQLAIAIGMCIELDRPILTGIQDMAVINGHVSIYGDAALAIVRKSGLLEYIIEEETGKPYADDWKFTCELKRKGSPKPRLGVWTWEDAKRAGFDDPRTRDGGKDVHSPWRRFTRRMMQFKARNFPLRDEFGDVIKGMTLAEDAQDIIDVTPIPSLKIEGRTEPAPGEDPYRVQEVPQGNGQAPGETTSPVIEFRKEWIDLKGAGYNPYIQKNFRRIEEMAANSPAILEEMKAKWAKLYPGKPWPLVEQVKEPEKAPDTESPPAEDPPQLHADDPPNPVGEEPALFPAKDVSEDNAFYAEVGDYWAALPDDEIAKILRGFDIKAPADLPAIRRKSFIATCKARLDKLNASK